MITQERAKFIIDNKLLMGGLKYSFRGKYGAYERSRIYPDGLTLDEVMALRELWDKMPGHTSFFDALNRVAKGLSYPI